MEGGLSRGLGIQAALGSVSVTGEPTGVKGLSRAGHRPTWVWLEVHAGSAETSESGAGVQIQDLCGRFWLSLPVTSSSFAETESHYRQTRRSSVWKWLRQTISRVGLSMTSWGLQVWGLRPTTLRGHWLCDSLSCQRTGSGLKQMLSGKLLVRSVL